MSDTLSVAVGLGTVALTTLYLSFNAIRNTFKERRLLRDLEVQSEPFEGDDNVRISTRVKDNKFICGFPNIKTVYDAFLHGMDIAQPSGKCLGRRAKSGGPYIWETYSEVYNNAQLFGSGLMDLWHQAGQDTFIGICSNNRNEWIHVDLCCSMYSMVSVPIYQTLGCDACVFIINEVKLETIVVEDEAKARDFLKMASQTPSLKRLIVIDPFEESLRNEAAEVNIELFTFRDIKDKGLHNMSQPVPPKPEDIYTLSYTSGTTGDPKGVILRHDTAILHMAGISEMLRDSPYTTITKDDTLISYLPLAHVYERNNTLNLYMNGGKIGFFRGDVRLLMDDIRELKPTVLPCVPRILNRIYDEVQNAVRGSLVKSTLLKLGVYFKSKYIRRGEVVNNSIWDKLVFSKVRQMLGGHVKFAASASAPVATEVLNFCRCAFGCTIIEAYGQTEFPLATMTRWNDFKGEHVGAPLPSCMIKLCDVPDMNYFSTDKKGEVCAKAMIDHTGYFRNPQKTSELIDNDGWLHTGDIGQWLPNGTLKIIDRKKNLFKLAQGEYIAPDKVENVYSQSQFVAQIFVDGNSLKRYIVAVVVPDPVNVEKFAKSQDIEGTYVELCQNKTIKEAILKDMISIGKSRKLTSLELVKDIHLHPKPFLIEDGLVTATLKNKRQALRVYFKDEVEGLYGA